jgi:hypothetical protein
VWLGFVICAVVLASRLVNAVEQITRSVAREHPPDSLKPE